MKTMVRTIRFLAAALLIPAALSAQLQSISAAYGVSLPSGKRIGVQTIKGAGGAVNVRFALAEDVSIALEAGYRLYNLAQTNELFGWNWDFWNNRYWSKIQADLRADPALSARFASVHTMSVVPVMLRAGYALHPSDNIVIRPSLGAGVMFSVRSLYVAETWTKRFDAANYAFTYTIRNFAPDKRCNPLAASAGCECAWQAFDEIGFHAGVQYLRMIPTDSDFGYSLFPFDDEVTLSFGLTFTY